jgi:hypothetical protein
MPLIPEIVTAWMLMQPMDFKHEVCWAGFESYQAGNHLGWTGKLVIWAGGSVVLELGRWNRLAVVKTLW